MMGFFKTLWVMGTFSFVILPMLCMIMFLCLS